MAKPISEQALEDVVVVELVKAGYLLRQTSAYDKSLCLDAGPLIDFIQATHPNPTRKRGTEPRGQHSRPSLAHASGCERRLR